MNNCVKNKITVDYLINYKGEEYTSPQLRIMYKVHTGGYILLHFVISEKKKTWNRKKKKNRKCTGQEEKTNQPTTASRLWRTAGIEHKMEPKIPVRAYAIAQNGSASGSFADNAAVPNPWALYLNTKNVILISEMTNGTKLRYIGMFN